ncbi:MAG TPA: GIY-YIG nuclease family protein [Candidatus Peribacteraceae bacterium]|nr:GIY-YIG nuclease family protein [Candidatus Peribacteraceae bacterium]
MREFFVYILRCSDGSYYIGVTNNYEKRIAEHKEGFDPLCYTYKRRPLELIHLEIFSSILDAIHREKQLKRWSRKKKGALIMEHAEQLMFFAKRKRVQERFTIRHGEVSGNTEPDLEP